MLNLLLLRRRRLRWEIIVQTVVKKELVVVFVLPPACFKCTLVSGPSEIAESATLLASF